MKIRNPRLIRVAGRVGAAAIRALIRSLSCRVHFHGPDVGNGRLALDDRLIYSIWHEHLLLPAARFGGPDLAVLISAHADGQLLGGLIEAMGMAMVKGSSTRGGVEALRKLVQPGTRWRNLAVTPDGPRGPRRVVQPGMVYVASRTGMKIICTGVAYDRPWRLGSWDRFAIPQPFSRARIVVSAPLAVPSRLGANGLEEARQRIQGEMDRVQEQADAWLTAGQRPPRDPSTAPEPPRRAAG